MLAFTKTLSYLFFLILLSEGKAKNYCGPNYCSNSKQHTLCKYQSSDPARHCVEFENTIRSAKEKQAILDKLNSRRNKVAGGEIKSLPSAENMMKLEWSEELEISAQRWANQCVKHSSPDIKDTCRDLGSLWVEQNIATVYGEAPGLTPLALVDVWYMELLNFNASILPRYQTSKSAGVSHYDYFTQLVWAKSKQVGCGGVKFKERLQDLGNDKKRAVYRLVCNFAPGGNILNHTVYDDGTPCSKCLEGTCDSVYTALCSFKHKTKSVERTEFEPTTNIFRSKIAKGLQRTEQSTVLSQQIDSVTNSEYDDNITPFDYFPHIHDFVRPTLATTTKKASLCKDLLGVDDFVELLKKKLSTDPIFKDLLQSSTPNLEQTGNGFTDALALIGKIYSNSMSPTTISMLPSKDYVNSTLLVDLVEAVIFRNSISDKVRNSQDIIRATVPEFYVSPVKIQAEFAEVNQNSDFTGHLFFPEDMDEESKSAESTEFYYDVPEPSVSEILEDFRRRKVTKDFLDEILDSEIVTEKYENLNIITNKRALRKQRKKRYNTLHHCNDNMNVVNGYNGVPEKCIKNMQTECGNIVIKYSQLLNRLAADIKLLQLNKIFHCSGSAMKCSLSGILLFLAILEISFCL